jgi:hypothetical protein
VTLPWQAVREGVDVKLLPQDQELYVLARSRARIHKERAMRRRKLKWLWAPAAEPRQPLRRAVRQGQPKFVSVAANSQALP